MIRTLTPLLFVACLACATGPTVRVDRAADAPLEQFKTFAIQEPGEAGGDPAYGPTARKAAEEAVAAAFAARGLTPSDRLDADLLVTVSTRLETREARGDLELRPRADVYTRRTAVRTPVADIPLGQETVVVPRQERVLDSGREIDMRIVIVDVRAAGSDELLWRGTSRMRGERLTTSRLRQHVEAVAEKFPGE